MSAAAALHVDSEKSFSLPSNRTWAIFLISALSLFLEIMLIRWIGTEIRIFAYLQNTVLIVCFLALGMGCFTSSRPIRLRHSLLALLALTAIMAVPFTRALASEITALLSVFNDFVVWGLPEGEPLGSALMKVSAGLVLTLLLMFLLWEVFLPLGRLLGRLMNQHPRIIPAYSANVAGSLVGIWLFAALSAVSLPPVVWLLALAAMLFCFLGAGRERVLNLLLLVGVIVAGGIAQRDSGAIEIAWSPYQKLVLSHFSTTDTKSQKWQGQYLITVNNASYQGMIDLSQQRVKETKASGIPAELAGMSQYDVPLRFKPEPENVLIVGAGSGNGVAGALRGGAKRVTGVEIDPAILAMGRRFHPEQPYASPRVRLVNDDARSFFASSGEKYDLIIFGLLDSHTTTSMTNARLDHYVYTRESLARARSLLTDDGVMVLSFEAAKPYISDRMATCIRKVFGKEPLTFRIPFNETGWGGVYFVAGNEQVIADSLKRDTRLAKQVDRWRAENPVELSYSTLIATDDWPYIYLDQPRIPILYFLLAGLMAVLVGYGRWRIRAPLVAGWSRSHWHFFFLGAAFLLLEVQNISKASVVLGNTWLVNGVIISGILTMVLVANLITARFPRIPLAPVAGCLLASTVGLYFIDISTLAFLPYASKAAIVGLLTTLPMLFSGILFIRTFAEAQRKDVALGANLLGALVGGMLQSVTFVLGVKALLLIVAAFYVAAILTKPRATPQPNEDAAEGKREQDTPFEAEQEELAEPALS